MAHRAHLRHNATKALTGCASRCHTENGNRSELAKRVSTKRPEYESGLLLLLWSHKLRESPRALVAKLTSVARLRALSSGTRIQASRGTRYCQVSIPSVP